MVVPEAENSNNFPLNVENVGNCAAANPWEVTQKTPEAKMAIYLSIPKQVPANTKGKIDTYHISQEAGSQRLTGTRTSKKGSHKVAG